ncbi:TIGR02678 family protein [Leifsonia sp. Leaf264]|uniref:TIGR02678 family protein n=1 Tax=Leifsonia sp. Leaf264 TaxID=1736314 RepID=UPI0006F7522C|nr:TIGR02678 family protein [Leifsonia sp. Leaf264]KQO98340.1 hypothetical protein ASF30_09780 [Leifsonia sp. Leaf264]
MIEEAIEPDLVAAARSLESTQFLDSATDKDMFALVRRHGVELKSRFSHNLGYRLIIEPGFARLLKAEQPDGTPARTPLRTGKGVPVTSARVYRDISLIAASLQAPGVGEQILISQLLTQIRADAAEAGIVLTETITDRRDFVTAITILISWGLITETDGSVADWSAAQHEVLLTVDRNRFPYLLANLSKDHGGRRVSALQSLTRKLTENPVVVRADLPEDEQVTLRQDRAKLEAALAMFGLNLELRREGALAWDDKGDITDDPFPGEGALRQAALLFINRATADRQASEDGWVTLTAGAATSVVQSLLDENKGLWRKEFEPDAPDAASRVLRDVLTYLTGFGLIKEGDGYITIHPATARYKPTIKREPTSTPPSPEPEQTALFDDLGEQ